MAAQSKTWRKIWNAVDEWFGKNPYYDWQEQKTRIVKEIRKQFPDTKLNFRVIWKQFIEWHEKHLDKNGHSNVNWETQEKKIREITERQMK